MADLKRITYVDDEDDMRSVVSVVLKKLGGFEVQTCRSGMEMLDRVAGFDPELILLDVMMPDMDGVETFERLRDLPEFSKTPVVFMTAKAQKVELEGYLALGATGVVPKPFKTMELSNDLRSIWQKHVESAGQ